MESSSKRCEFKRNNRFETIISPDENRATSFVTIINPFERNIQIPIDFYEQWERELHRLDYGRIVWNDRSVRVYFEFNDTEKVMYGYEVSYTFGILRPTKVRLEYQIKNNIFSLSLIESSDDQSLTSTGVLDEVEKDEPAQELQDVGHDEPVEKALSVDQKPNLIASTVFYFQKPTSVILNYEIDDNLFTMTLTNNEDIFDISGHENDSDCFIVSSPERSAHSYENIPEPPIDENEEINDESLYKWDLIVSKAYASRTKSQVLNLNYDGLGNMLAA
ncbi:hypothetical protein L195_g007101 [Trifolium pratense]|uniref:Uncharacterized protein n=1 Tax=Trifolium pratense TaxID=57577 RepID=A0A2K3P5G5_TRIPR|nr:hypothetical protein L195_g007101 [Trifolium pratense]